MSNKIFRIFHKIIIIQTRFSLWCLVTLIALNIVSAVVQFITHYSPVWIQEVTLLLAAWVIFIGFSSISYTHKDLVVDGLINRLPFGIKRACSVLVSLINIIFVILLSHSIQELIHVKANDRAILTGIPVVLYIYPILISAVSVMFCNILDILEVMGVAKRPEFKF